MSLFPRTLPVAVCALATAFSLTVAPASAEVAPPRPMPWQTSLAGPPRPTTPQPTPPPETSEESHQDAVEALDHVQDLLSAQHGSAAPGTGTTQAEGTAGATSPSPDLTLALQKLAMARGELTGAQRARANRILARPTSTTSSRDPDLIDYTAKELKRLHRDCSAHFCVHWTSARDAGRACGASGCDKVDNHASEETAAADLRVLEHVYAVETGKYRFRRPLADRESTNPANAGNPDPRFDVFLLDVGSLGYYGYTTVSKVTRTNPRRASAYLVLDNTFDKDKFCPENVDPSKCTSEQQSLEVTVAHEFFHAIQYNYDIDEAVWLQEGSAVWMEDQVYDDVNDYRQYAAKSPIRHPLRPVDDNGRASMLDTYGAFTLFAFLADWLHSPDAVRQVWQRATHRGVYSFRAVTEVLKAHHRSPRHAYGRFGVWNTLAPYAYPGEADGYGRFGAWRRITLAPARTSTGWLGVRLRHLASAPLVLTPGSRVPAGRRLRITVDLPRRSHGPVATVQIRRRNGTDNTRTVSLDRSGRGHMTVHFAPRSVKQVIVVLTNGSYSMVSCRRGSDPYLCGGRGKRDREIYRVHARVLS